jgi:hypothetical protein
MAKNKSNLTIEFSNQEALMNFVTWLCGQGEQGYWDWMEVRETEEDGDITVRKFHYHGKEDETKAVNDPKRYGAFMADNIIRTTVGRLDRKG